MTMAELFRAIWAKLMSARGRRWIYDVGLAAAPLLVVLNRITNEEASLWLDVLAAAMGLGLGTARSRVTPDPEEHQPGVDVPEVEDELDPEVIASLSDPSGDDWDAAEPEAGH